MASKSSKIAVTLQPSLKQKLREYGKENQIKNFSGVILAILDEYLGEGSPAATSSDAPSDDVWSAIHSLTERLESLEGGSATTAEPKASSPVSKPKPKPSSTRRTGTRTKSTASKPAVKRTNTKSSGKSASTTKPTAKKGRPPKPQKATVTKAKTGRASKSSSKAAPAKKTTTRKGAPRKLTKVTKADWMSTREAFDIYGGKLSWSRFSKLTPEELKERFNLDSDLSRKVRGSRFNQWLKPGK